MKAIFEACLITQRNFGNIEIWLHISIRENSSVSSCTSNHHKGRFDSTKAVRQRIPKVTISSGSAASVSIYSIQVCPRTFVIPPGSLTCNGATSRGNIVIYIWGAELKAICICSTLALNGVSYLVVYIHIIKTICQFPRNKKT